MPIEVTTAEETTTLSFLKRCTMDDALAAREPLIAALQAASSLRIESGEAESIDTSCLQFALSAIATSGSTSFSGDDFFRNALTRWGISNIDTEE